MIRRPPRSTRTDTLFPYTTLCRSGTLSALRTRPRDEEIACSNASALLPLSRCWRWSPRHRQPYSPKPPPASRWRAHQPATRDRTSVAQGKSVSVSVDLGGRRIVKKKKDTHKYSAKLRLTKL